MTQPQLYLVGAYKEHSGASMGTLEALLGALHRDTSITVTVRLAAVWEANTDAETGALVAYQSLLLVVRQQASHVL
jgi:hypothetical protein